MDKFDRIQQIDRLLRNHKYPVSLATMAEDLECVEKTIKRNIETMQRYGAPIQYNQEYKGWEYIDDEHGRFELPGIWLTAGELQSLSLLINLLDDFAPGELNKELGPIDSEINKLLTARGIKPSAFRHLIKILPINNKPLPNHCFQQVSEGLLKSKQLIIHYESYNHIKTERRISPQSLIYYRENWYLDAWCHLRNNLRTFSLARINQIEILQKTLKNISEEQKEQHFADAYGLFSGKAKHTAVLRFSPAVAREIAQQQWHPKQKGEWDGMDYILTLPYADDRELVQDILRHSPNVFVEKPAVLRKRVQNKLQSALGVFTGKEIKL